MITDKNNEADFPHLGDKILNLVNDAMIIACVVEAVDHVSWLAGIGVGAVMFFIGSLILSMSIEDPLEAMSSSEGLQEIADRVLWKISLFNLSVFSVMKLVLHW